MKERRNPVRKDRERYRVEEPTDQKAYQIVILRRR
jgi:hypothetical protein